MIRRLIDRRLTAALFLLVLLGASGPAGFPELLLALVLVLFAAKIGGDVAVRAGQPEVLGELAVGLLLGNLHHFGLLTFEFLKTTPALEALSELGVILLLFQVGLETNIREMRKVGLSALVVAVLGVCAPLGLGWATSSYFNPDASTLVHAFVGATLAATSVGITARVLKELDRVRSKEGQVILGAAVIDDVLGLVVLSVVTGAIAAAQQGEALDATSTLSILGLALLFLVGSLLIGAFLSPRLFYFANRLQSQDLLLAFSLVVCFGFAYLAAESGLAPIVGAFTAGLILEPVHYEELSARQGTKELEELIHPITSLLLPIFFVRMGAMVDLSVFLNSSIQLFAFMLVLAAIIGKQVCGLGILEKGIDRIAVGLGMIPRGEVGLIFASVGASLELHGEPVIDSGTFGAVLIMVMVTTMVTPPLVKLRFTQLARATA